MALTGKVCLVTGATRGLGRGIAIQLGENGATVYITGRTLEPQPSGDVKGSLAETAREVEERGGKCVPVQCDHSVDAEIEDLFARIQREQDGRLDLLVNNAFSAGSFMSENRGVKFWEQPLSSWDTVNNVGLRSHYLSTMLAARMMVPRRSGLILNVSSAGGIQYIFHVLYGIGKEALDRMAVDCGLELKSSNVACLSLWTGGVNTERLNYLVDKHRDMESSLSAEDKSMIEYMLDGETTEYIGKCVVNLALDQNIMKKTAKVHISMDLGDEYGFVDIDGRSPLHLRRLSTIVKFDHRFSWLSKWIPNFIKIPTLIVNMSANKFF